jgi:hypothetical protein
VELVPGLRVVLHCSGDALRLLTLLNGRFGNWINPDVVSLSNFAFDGNEEIAE